MKKDRILKVFSAFLLAATIGFGVIACSSGELVDTPVSINQETTNTQNNSQNEIQTNTPTPAPANTRPITIVWYPNESSNDYEASRNELGRLIEEATGRSVLHRLTTDYVIAIESIASASADIGAVFGAVGMLEAQQRNPAVHPLVVNSGPSGTLDDAVYFAWLAVNKGEEEQYRSDDSFSIENIQGRRMSFVSNSSTSGFRVPSSRIIDFFGQKDEWRSIDEDDILGLSRNPFFSEVLFGGSHQGSLFNLLDGRADIAAVCDIIVDSYIELVDGVYNELGSTYAIQQDAAAPFDNMGGREFFLIGVVPVLNGPIVYNPQNFSAEEIQAIREILTSDATANNSLIFGAPGEFALYPKDGDNRYVVAENSWYDPLR
jgi:phosphonate transport system substrate-binding protein